MMCSLGRSDDSQGSDEVQQSVGLATRQEPTCASHVEGTRGHAGAAPLWTRDPIWQGHVANLVDFPAISILELCAGTGAATCALQQLLDPTKVRLAGAWDTDAALQRVYDVAHPGCANIHLGSRGDILKTPLKDFPSANIVVAGPPCPPFSACGRRGRLSDDRARPFEQCINVLVELDNRSKGRPGHATSTGQPGDDLMFFVLENVSGIAFRDHGGSSDLHQLCKSMKRRLGAAWLVRPMELNASQYGLPQNRPRIYIVGRKVAEYGRIPGAPTMFSERVSAARLLDLTDNEQAPRLTDLQQRCHDEWKGLYRSAMLDQGNKGMDALVEVGRDPTPRTRWGNCKPGRRMPVDRCQCLRAAGPQIQVFALGEGVGDLSLDRNLRIHERAALQGFPSTICHIEVTERVGRRIFGNAMAVPVIGSVLAQELSAIQDASRQSGGICEAGNAEDQKSVHRGHAKRTSVGPATRALVQTWHPPDEELDVMPGQRAAVIALAKTMWTHWDGRAPKQRRQLEPADHMALARRSIAQPLRTEILAPLVAACASQTRASAASSSAAHPTHSCALDAAGDQHCSSTGIPAAAILHSSDDEQPCRPPGQRQAPGDESDDSGHSDIVVFGTVV